MKIPDNLQYTTDHEWINFINGIATIGITDYAQGELGDIIFIEYPEIGNNYQVGDTIATIEAVKTVADLYSPIEGTVLEVNSNLENAPETINKDPYNNGWIVKLNTLAIDKIKLLSPHEYNKLIQ